jgi:uncharacterized protein YjbI with pentapeptide repeats
MGSNRFSPASRLSQYRLPHHPSQAAEAASATPKQKRAKLAEGANNLDSMRKAVEDAAAVSAGLWLSYLFAFFYVAIAAAAVTPVDLLLQNPVKLPFLNIELPLLAFFVLAPFLFIISHTYTLVHFVMLAAKVGEFHRAKQLQIPDDEAIQEALRRQLPSNVFVQFLAGANEIREGGLGRILKSISWLTLVIGPVLLLLLLQIQFLAFHNETITLMHRAAIIIDLMLLWALWPAILASRSKIQWPSLAVAKTAVAASILAVGFSWLVATFPGEPQDEVVAALKLIPVPNEDEDPKGPVGWTSIHDLVFSGSVNPLTGRRRSPFSNTLVLTGFNIYEAQKIDDPKKVEWREHSIDLHARDLNGAVFLNANLTKANLLGAKLQGATLDGATLQGASLNGAQLQGASLNRASVQGASLEDAQLQGASLVNIQLQGSSLLRARLQGASLSSAQLHGASLANAQLQGALLDDAQLQGALLAGANLKGASLNRANLQGSALEGAQLHSASLLLSLVWMAETHPSPDPQNKSTVVSNFTLQDARVAFVSIGQCANEQPGDACTFEDVKRIIESKVPQGSFRDLALTRIEKRLGSADPWKEKRIASEWLDFSRAPPESDVFERSLIEQLRATGCDPDGAPYVMRGFLKRAEVFEGRRKLATYFLSQESCPGARGLSKDEKAKLKEIRGPASPVAPAAKL